MKKVYLYPLTARTENAVINPYIGNLKDALNQHFEVINASNPSKTGIFDFLKYIRKVDIVFFNWIEEVPELHRGKIQGIFLLLLLPYLKRSSIRIVWTLHNKESHSGQKSWLKKKIYSQMLKESDLIITHASEGLDLIPPGKKASFQAHPIEISGSGSLEKKDSLYDIIIWGTIAPYKGLVEFLNILEEDGAIGNYKILMAGKVSSPALANELQSIVKKYNNLSLIDAYVEKEKLIDLIHRSKVTLFTYHSDSILSSGALMDSLSYGASIVGPAVGAFNDLQNLGLIDTYSDLKSLTRVLDTLLASTDEDPQRRKNISEFIAANTWKEYSLTLARLIEQP